MREIARLDPYRVLTEQEREAHLSACRDFLLERDGIPDVAARTLSVREARMREYEENPVVWDGALDREAFARAFAGDRTVELDARTQWALAAAKSNEGETYGVELELRRFAGHGVYKGLRAPEILVTQYMQEAYHCRLLVELCRSCGIDFRPRRPAWTNRVLITLMGLLPPSVKWIPGMAGEVVGAAVFGTLYARTSLFDENPSVQKRLRTLLREIWLDESIHVSYLRSQNGRLGLAVVRALVPIVAWVLLEDLPPLRKIGITARGILEWIRDGIPIPGEVAWLEGTPAEQMESGESALEEAHMVG
jgi:hypothetical protein